jgi:hypothetical protein
MSEAKKLIRCRVAMVETGSIRTAFVVCSDWQTLDDWAAESRCEIMDAEVVACSCWNDNVLCVEAME